MVVVGGTEQHAVRAIRAPTLGLLAAATCLLLLLTLPAPILSSPILGRAALHRLDA